MLTQIDSLREDTLVYELDGYITKEEIEYIEKGIEFMLTAFDKINLMVYINAKGESLSSLLEEFQLGANYANRINKIAYISNKNYWKLVIAIDNLSTQYREKYFDVTDIAKAWDWIYEE